MLGEFEVLRFRIGYRGEVRIEVTFESTPTASST